MLHAGNSPVVTGEVFVAPLDRIAEVILGDEEKADTGLGALGFTGLWCSGRESCCLIESDERFTQTRFADEQRQLAVRDAAPPFPSQRLALNIFEPDRHQ